MQPHNAKPTEAIPSNIRASVSEMKQPKLDGGGVVVGVGGVVIGVVGGVVVGVDGGVVVGVGGGVVVGVGDVVTVGVGGVQGGTVTVRLSAAVGF